MTQGTHNVGVIQVLGKGHLHGGPIWCAFDILVLLWCYDLQHQNLAKMPQNYQLLQGYPSKLQDLTRMPLKTSRSYKDAPQNF